MLHLSYILHEHGWAVATFGDNTTSVEAHVSYLGDALAGLARAARGILRGLPETSFSFLDEPGEYRFRVTRHDDRVTIRVERFRKLFARPDEVGELVFETDSSVREFADECINVLRRVFDEHGEAGYRERW